MAALPTFRGVDPEDPHSARASVAARRARGDDWPEAVGTAKAWLAAALEPADTLGIGTGRGPVHHFHQCWD